MTELISPHQAQVLMLAVLVAAPIVGLLWGVAITRVRFCFLVGLAVGVGNFALWSLYNAITDRLGLDTVKNLLVNLAIFLAFGIAVGLIAGRFAARRSDSSD